MIYLDYNATAPMKQAVITAMVEAMERHGNPSSVHRFGRISRRYVEEARSAVAAFVGVKPAQVVFTGGGTEANNMVFYNESDHNIITSSIEHDSVLATTPEAVRMPVTSHGIIDLGALEEQLKSASSRFLVSVMMVNNETGVVQPIHEIARLVKFYDHHLHTDAIQAAGRLPLDFKDLGVDYLTLSAHKIGGPQGLGALIVNEKMPIKPFIRGGGQEMNRRAGTENVSGIVGFGVAALLAADDLLNVPNLCRMRDNLQKKLLEIAGNDAVVVGDGAPRVANTLNIAMRRVSSETQVMAMDLAGIALSSGSACSSGKVKVSHVVRAMGFADDISSSTLRISLGWNTQASDIDRCVEAWRTVYQRTRANQSSEAA